MTTTINDIKLDNEFATKTHGGVVPSGADSTFDTAKALFKASPAWPTPVSGRPELLKQLIKVRDMGSVAAGDAEHMYLSALKHMKDKGFDTTMWERAPKAADSPMSKEESPQALVKVAEGYEVKGGKVVKIIDMVKYHSEVQNLLTSITKLDLPSKVAKASSEQDFFELVKKMLEDDLSYKLIGVLAVRLLVSKADREELDEKLVKVGVLTNKDGKLSTGVVRLGGYVGLASVKGEPLLAKAVKYTKNPLLGEDVENRAATKRKEETSEQFKSRKEAQEQGFASYKEIMTQMKAFKAPYEALGAETIAKIRAGVMSVAFAE